MLSSCCCESVISLSSCVFVSSRCCIDSNISFDSVSLRIVSQFSLSGLRGLPVQFVAWRRLSVAVSRSLRHVRQFVGVFLCC